MIKHTTIRVTTDAAGAAAELGVNLAGAVLYAIQWMDGTFDDGLTATISVVNTEMTYDLVVLAPTKANADKMYYPRIVGHDSAGADLTADKWVQPIINGTLKLTISAGGNTKTGGCVIFYS